MITATNMCEKLDSKQNIYLLLMKTKILHHVINANTANIIAEYAQDVYLECIECCHPHKLSCPDQWIEQLLLFSNKYRLSNGDIAKKLYFCEKNQIYILENQSNQCEILCYECRDTPKGRRQCIICGELFRWRIMTNQDDINHHIAKCVDCLDPSLTFCSNNIPNCTAANPCFACYVNAVDLLDCLLL